LPKNFAVSVRKIFEDPRRDLWHVESSILYDRNGCRYRLPSKLSEYAEKIYRATGVQRGVRAEKWSIA
jgi:hypothetical protein